MRLGELLGNVIKPIQITPEIAEDIANALRSSDVEAERHRTDALRHLEQRRRAMLAKLDRGYDDFVEGRITEEFWTRKSQAWEAELRVIDASMLALSSRDCRRTHHRENVPSAMCAKKDMRSSTAAAAAAAPIPTKWQRRM